MIEGAFYGLANIAYMFVGAVVIMGIYEILRGGAGKMDQCSICNAPFGAPITHHTSNYGIDEGGRKICYKCCAQLDLDYMRSMGKISLYLTMKGQPSRWGSRRRYDEGGILSNWTNLITIPIKKIRIGRHNIAGVRYDLNFTFEGANWAGTQYGDNTMICHCRRLKY